MYFLRLSPDNIDRIPLGKLSRSRAIVSYNLVPLSLPEIAYYTLDNGLQKQAAEREEEREAAMRWVHTALAYAGPPRTRKPRRLVRCIAPRRPGKVW